MFFIYFITIPILQTEQGECLGRSKGKTLWKWRRKRVLQYLVERDLLPRFVLDAEDSLGRVRQER